MSTPEESGFIVLVSIGAILVLSSVCLAFPFPLQEVAARAAANNKKNSAFMVSFLVPVMGKIPMPASNLFAII